MKLNQNGDHHNDGKRELWACQKIVTSSHTIDSVPKVINLNSVAECGGVLVQIGDDCISCTEFGENGKLSSAIGQGTKSITIDGGNIGDVVEISYSPYASVKIGEIDEYATNMELIGFNPHADYNDRRHANRRMHCTVDIEFSNICTACKLYNTVFYGMIIRDFSNNKTIFAVPQKVPCKLHPYVTVGEKQFKPHEYVGDVIEWAGGIDCDYYWITEFK